MPAPYWKGYLKLSLVTVPVKAYTAAGKDDAEIHFHQLHADCHSRIQYKKTCPIHGEVSKDAILSGYEYAKGQYVVVDPAELDKLRTEDEKAVTIDTFISPDALDLMYFSGKAYYLAPDGPVGQRPFAVLFQGMVEENRYAIAQMVLHGRDQLVLLRPMDGLLAMSVLNYDHQVTKPAAFEDQAPKVELADEERELADTLVAGSTAKQFDFSTYKDRYTEKLTELIDAKVAGKEIVAPPPREEARVINLMDALRESVTKLQPAAATEADAKPPRKMAPSRGRTKAARRRKAS
jgi:DNA end-binding protein Ku